MFPSDVGARNHRRFCAVNYNKTPGFEVSEKRAFKLVLLSHLKMVIY